MHTRVKRGDHEQANKKNNKNTYISRKHSTTELNNQIYI